MIHYKQYLAFFPHLFQRCRTRKKFISAGLGQDWNVRNGKNASTTQFLSYFSLYWMLDCVMSIITALPSFANDLVSECIFSRLWDYLIMRTYNEDKLSIVRTLSQTGSTSPFFLQPEPPNKPFPPVTTTCQWQPHVIPLLKNKCFRSFCPQF